MRYFSPSNLGFYDDIIHGARKIPVIQTAVEIKAKKRPRMINNIRCTIPADAVQISDQDYQKIQTELSEGRVLAARGGKAVTVAFQQDPAEIEALNRQCRQRLLAASDWTQLVDAPIDETLRSPWQAYRQQLRDLDLTNPDWPVSPGSEEAEA